MWAKTSAAVPATAASSPRSRPRLRPSVQITDRFTVQASREKVWQLLWDFPRLAACLPGCREITRVNDVTYRAKMKQSVGPFNLDMDMTFNIVEVDEGRRIVFSGS